MRSLFFLPVMLGLIFIAACSPTPQTADSAMIVKPSHHDVATTVQRLQAQIQERGAKVVAVVDHGAAGRAIGMDLQDMQLVIFGDAKLGSALIEQEPKVGLDLPMKILVWKDAQGQTEMGFTDPVKMGGWYGLPPVDPVLTKMRGIYEHVTREAGR